MTNIVPTQINSAVPTTPWLPASLKRLVSAMLAVTVGRTMPGWKVPRQVDSETKRQAVEALASYGSYLAVAGRKAVLECIAGLMAHYFVPGMADGLQAKVAGDWADDLAGFPLWAVQAACEDWRHENDRRPTPHQIVARCADLVFEDRKVVQRLEKLAEAPEGSCPKISDGSPPKPGHQQRVADLVAGCIKTMSVAESKGKRADVSKRKRRPVSWDEERALNREALNTKTMLATSPREGETGD